LRAEEVEGGHRVTGEWTMSSGSRHATWIGLMALPVDASGAQLPLPPGATMRVFLTPASSVAFIENWNVVGLIATNSGGFKGENIFVPHGQSIHLPYPRSLQPAGPLYKFPLNNLFGIGFAAVALGVARTMMDEVIALAREKKPWLARQPLQQSQLAQFQIGEAEARLRSARAYMESIAARVWQSVVSTGELTIPQRVDIRMATTFAIHEAKTVADAAWDVAGATAIFLSNPFERRLRDLRTLTQQLQGRKSHLQDCGAYLLGLEPNLRHA
jgi:alkylation response protein AidB-like acyl-CoA dehydrogenase